MVERLPALVLVVRDRPRSPCRGRRTRGTPRTPSTAGTPCPSAPPRTAPALTASRPRTAPSTYDSVRNTASRWSRCTFRYAAISAYGSSSVISVARRKWHRNGTSGIAPTSRSASAATAIEIPPPWLAPVTATRSGSHPRVGAHRVDRAHRVGEDPPVVVRLRVEHAAGHEARVRRAGRAAGVGGVAGGRAGALTAGVHGEACVPGQRPDRDLVRQAAAAGVAEVAHHRRQPPARPGRDVQPGAHRVRAVAGERDVVRLDHRQPGRDEVERRGATRRPASGPWSASAPRTPPGRAARAAAGRTRAAPRARGRRAPRQPARPPVGTPGASSPG